MTNIYKLIYTIIIFMTFQVMGIETIEAQKVKVGVTGNSIPMAFMDNGDLMGMDIDIFNVIADEMKWQVEYVNYYNVLNLLNAQVNKEIDFAISGLTINSKRESMENIEFSTPYYKNGGLKLMVNSEQMEFNLKDKFLLAWPTLFSALITLLVILTFFAHGIWLIERFNGDENNFSSNYFKGIAQSYWWALVTATTVGYGDITPKKFQGRLMASVVIIFGIMWYGSFTASMSSVLTMMKIDRNNVSLETIKGNTIGTKANSTSHDFLKRNSNINLILYNDISDACRDVASGKIDGVVFDAPQLEYFAKNNNNLKLSDSFIKEESYGFIMPNDFIDNDKINGIILKMQEDGRLNKIIDSWL